MHGCVVDTACRLLRARAAEACAERDVRGGVLVEERVEIRASALSDPRCRVDERDLAEPPSVARRVAVDVRRDEISAFLLVGLEPDVERRARAAELEAGEPELREPRRAPGERAGMREPARRALPVLVGEAAEPEEVLREATLAVLGSKVRVDLTRPVVRRPACTRPPGVQIQ